jgi:hypothetical protein
MSYKMKITNVQGGGAGIKGKQSASNTAGGSSMLNSSTNNTKMLSANSNTVAMASSSIERKPKKLILQQ